MRIHNETHAKQHELYSDNQKMAGESIANRLDSLEQRKIQLRERVTKIEARLPELTSIEDFDHLEDRVRTIEMGLSSVITDKKSDDDNRATWLLVGLTLFAALLGLLSNLLGYFI